MLLLWQLKKWGKRKQWVQSLETSTFPIITTTQCSLSQTMISIAQYELSCNGDTTKILSKESSLCPICGGALKVHGTCTRKVRYGDCIHKYHLRVLKCQCCGKTHRELPDSLIPYKRYGVEAFCEIAESTEARHTCETSTWLRIRSWLAWFICYAQNIATGLIAANLLPMTFHPGYTLRQQTVHFVRLVANSGNWIQHRSAMTMDFPPRSEERRVGKECRSRWSPYH